MSHLKVREIPFRFDEKTPYYWNPHNPYWGNAVNVISVVAPAFERYFIKAFREVMPRISDAARRDDADLFCRQEGQHSKQHYGHLKALIKQHPGLEDVRRKVMASYDELFENECIEFHLAYAATVELTFGPIAKFIVENRARLFWDCDNQVAALILWHFVEEFEHRNSAIDVYKHVVGSYAWRMRMAPRVFAHLKEVHQIATEGMSQHTPALAWQGIEVRGGETAPALKDIPFPNRLQFYWHLLCSQMPLHRPDRLAQPEWVTRWFAAEAAGKDMSVYVP